MAVPPPRHAATAAGGHPFPSHPPSDKQYRLGLEGQRNRRRGRMRETSADGLSPPPLLPPSPRSPRDFPAFARTSRCSRLNFTAQGPIPQPERAAWKARKRATLNANLWENASVATGSFALATMQAAATHTTVKGMVSGAVLHVFR
eukprot:363336-Chlamydomonas_euryale.AAC.4